MSQYWSVYGVSYHAANRERDNARHSAYNAANREKLKQLHAANYAANIEEEREKRRDYYKNNPEVAKASASRRRARKAGAPINDLTDDQWKEILVAFKNRCVYCPDNCWRCRQHKHDLTQDHIIPLSKGGSHTKTNVVPACGSCNRKKHAGPPLKPVQPLLFTIA